MSRSDRRRARAEHLATGGKSTAPIREAREEGAPPPPPAPPRQRRSIRFPTLPLAVIASAGLLLGTAWTTRFEPGEAASAPQQSRFTVEIPSDQQAAINSWERFFICYDLLDARIVDLTLRANQRATGSLDFPGPRVEVELPAADGSTSPGGANEEELIRVRQAVLDAGSGRIADVRRQCGFPEPAPQPSAPPAGNESRGNTAAPAMDSPPPTR